MKENGMLEQMFSAVAQLLEHREEALLEKVAALEKRVEELEQKLQEIPVVEVPAVVSAVGAFWSARRSGLLTATPRKGL